MGSQGNPHLHGPRAWRFRRKSMRLQINPQLARRIHEGIRWSLPETTSMPEMPRRTQEISSGEGITHPTHQADCKGTETSPMGLSDRLIMDTERENLRRPNYYRAGKYVKIRTKQGGRRRLVEARCQTCGFLAWRSKGRGCPAHTKNGQYCGSMTTERWVEWSEIEDGEASSN